MKRNCFGCSCLLVAFWLWLCPSNASAAAPANDSCIGAVIIPDGPFPHLTAAVDLSLASNAGDPVEGCIDEGGSDVSNSIWYRFAPGTTRRYTFSVGTDSGSTVDDSVIIIYTSANGCAGTMMPVDCSDDEAGLQAAVSLTLQAGTTYYVVVSAGSLVDFSDGSIIRLRVTAPTSPTNDACTGAEVIPTNASFPYLTTVVDTTLATTAANDPAANCVGTRSRSVWFRFTPPTTTIYEFSTCTNTATSVFDTAMAIYASPNGCAGPFTLVNCNDNGCGAKARMTNTLEEASTYYIVVWETLDEEPTLSETSVQLRVSMFTAPSVVTSPATSVSSGGALLNAQVSPKGLATTVWFEWGATTNYGSTTTPQVVGGTVGQMNVASFVSELTPGQLYHFRARATNSLGSAIGADRTFQWSNTRPVLRLIKPPGGEATVVFTGSPGQVYWVEAVANLEAWSLIGSAAEVSPGNFQFTDPLSDVVSKRFYQIFSP